MSRAATVCAEAGCPHPAVHRGRCFEHAARPWQGSRERREQAGLALPSHVRRKVRAAAGYRCANCGEPVPHGTGAVDHLHAGDPASPLQLLCSDCDRVKTRADLDAMRRTRTATTRGEAPRR